MRDLGRSLQAQVEKIKRYLLLALNPCNCVPRFPVCSSASWNCVAQVTGRSSLGHVSYEVLMAGTRFSCKSVMRQKQAGRQVGLKSSTGTQQTCRAARALMGRRGDCYRDTLEIRSRCDSPSHLARPGCRGRGTRGAGSPAPGTCRGGTRSRHPRCRPGTRGRHPRCRPGTRVARTILKESWQAAWTVHRELRSCPRAGCITRRGSRGDRYSQLGPTLYPQPGRSKRRK